MLIYEYYMEFSLKLSNSNGKTMLLPVKIESIVATFISFFIVIVNRSYGRLKNDCSLEIGCI